MDLLIFPTLTVLGMAALNVRDQRRRMALLGGYLGRHQIETLIQKLMQGYLRALDETDPQRQRQIWNLLASAETQLGEKFSSFVLEFSKVGDTQAKGSTLAFGLPYAARVFPQATFDLRKVLGIHARGLVQAIDNAAQQPPKRKAFTVSAELYLMQHSCHWFCRSKSVASARLLAHHKTSYAQVLASVTPQTRDAYLALMVPIRA